MLVFFAYASVQVSQLGGATPTYDVYDSDNYLLVSSSAQVSCRSHDVVYTMLVDQVQ